MKLFAALAVTILSAALSAQAVVSTNALGQVITTVNGVSTIVLPSGNAASPAYGKMYSQSVTNGQAVTLVADAVNLLTGVNSAANGTNTITISNFAAADVGKVVWVVVPSTSTNLVAVAKTGNYAGTALELSAGQAAPVIPVSTTVIVGQ